MTHDQSPTESGRLYVVSTPIGNMGDFSFRAVEVLKSVQVVLAEDTRHSRPLLDRYDIRAQVSSYHEHNEARATPRIIERLQAGEDVALISDAGTPLISDPGARLISGAIAAGITVVPIPGASALLAALVASGLPSDTFTFHGFLPRRGRARRDRLDEIASSARTSVIFEAHGRVADSLREIAERTGPERAGVVARELTKRFEEVRRGTLGSLVTYYNESPPRGEVVVLIAGAAPAAVDEEALVGEASSLRARGLSVRDVAVELVKRGIARNTAYRIARSTDGK